MGFSATKTTEEVGKNNCVIYKLQTIELANQFEEYIENNYPCENDIYHRRVDDYRVEAPRGLDWHFVNWLDYQNPITRKPVNTTVDVYKWHQLTNWKHAEELYKNNKYAWEKMKKERHIPSTVVKRVEK